MDIEHGMERIKICHMSDQTHTYAEDVIYHVKEMAEKEKNHYRPGAKVFRNWFQGAMA